LALISRIISTQPASDVTRGTHDVVDMREQLAAQRTTRVRARKVLGAETAGVEQRHRERVPQRKLRRGAGGRGEVERAGLLRHAVRQHQIGVRRQRRLGPAGHADQRHAQALQGRQDGRQLVALAGVGNRQHHVAAGDHAEVAVAGLGGVDEQRGRAGGGQGRGDLASDMAALAHAHHDHATGTAQDRFDHRREARALLVLQLEQRLGLDAQGLTGHADGPLGIEGRCGRGRSH